MKLFFKGMAMGASDVIPGVSGGTIALILGIYQDFILSLSKINISWLKLLLSFQFKKLWEIKEFKFLLTLGSGILTAILLGARLITLGLAHIPEYIWGFFLGLILASVIFLLKEEKKKILSWIFFILGALAAFFLTTQNLFTLHFGPWQTFIAGLLAISAMLLPGISGSYILLIIGYYERIIHALKEIFNRESLVTLIIFSCGCLIGLLLTSRFIKWLLTHYRHYTMMLLIGFMLGATPKLMPWKESTFNGGMYDYGVVVVIIISFVISLFYTILFQSKERR